MFTRVSPQVRAAFIRALRTAIQATLGFLIPATTLADVDWTYALSAVALTTVISFLSGLLSSLPELPTPGPLARVVDWDPPYTKPSPDLPRAARDPRPKDDTDA